MSERITRASRLAASSCSISLTVYPPCSLPASDRDASGPGHLQGDVDGAGATPLRAGRRDLALRRHAGRLVDGALLVGLVADAQLAFAELHRRAAVRDDLEGP